MNLHPHLLTPSTYTLFTKSQRRSITSHAWDLHTCNTHTPQSKTPRKLDNRDLTMAPFSFRCCSGSPESLGFQGHEEGPALGYETEWKLGEENLWESEVLESERSRMKKNFMFWLWSVSSRCPVTICHRPNKRKWTCSATVGFGTVINFPMGGGGGNQQ